MSEAPIPTETPKVKSPLKKRHEAIKFFFGQPLESFENLLNIQPSTSDDQSKIKPTGKFFYLNIIAAFYQIQYYHF